MIAWQPFFDELVANIRIAWPDVKTTGGGGIHDRNEMSRMTIERISAFPYCVVDLASAPSADWGIQNSMFEVRCDVRYVTKIETGMRVLRDKLDSLRHQFLRASAFQQATCLDATDITLSTDDEGMAVLIAKNMAFLCGRCTFVFVIGELITDTPP